MTTSVTFLLDKSGSMRGIINDTLNGFNAYLGGLRDSPDTFFSLVLFDTNAIDKVHVNVPVADVPALTHAAYRPDAGTPLIDASVKTIRAVEKAVAEKPDTKVVICIQTDGQENDSREYTWQQLSDLIKEKTALGWQFNFIGSGIDSYAQGRKMGISPVNTVSYDPLDAAATQSMFTEQAAMTRSYASGARADMSYSAETKAAVGDKFWADRPAPDLDLTKAHLIPKVIHPLVTTTDVKPVVDDFTL